MIQLLEIAASFTETFFGLWFPAKALKNERIKWEKSILYTLALTIIVGIFNQYAIFSFLVSIVGIVLISAGTCWIYRIKYLEVLPMVGFYMMITYACDSLCLSFMGVILHMPEFATYVTSDLSWYRSIFLIVTKIFTFLTVSLLAKIYFKYGIKRYNVVLFYIGELIVLYYMIGRTLSYADFDVTLLWLALFLLNILGIYSAVQRSIATDEKKGSQIEKARIRMLTEDYKLLSNSYNYNRTFYHDLKNQYLVIKSYLKQKEYGKAEEYMENIQDFKHEEIVAYTGNEVLDLILSHKINAARRQEIDVSVTAEQISLPLTDQEIVALIANILDNAIEACQKVEESKWIEIIIRQIKDVSFIKISNTYLEEPQIKDNVFVSKKKEQNLHGIGLNSIKSIVKKNSGEIDINYGNGIFKLTISFFH